MNNSLYRKFFKRVIDFCLSLLALIFLSPLLLFVALLVRVKLGSPVLFKQERPGKNEKIFTLYKFRTMTDARDEDGNFLLDSKRKTKLGNLMRKTSIDELPELVNILKGDMSIVGPRPLVVEYLPYYTNEERRRHEVRPGLTGLAQVSGRSFLSWEDRFKLDIEYVDSCSILLDIKIVLKTVKLIATRKGVAEVGDVYQDEKGTYLCYEGKMFRRLDVERGNDDA